MKLSASVAIDGTLRIHDHERWVKWLWKHKTQPVEVEIRSEAKARTSQANRFWHGVVVPLVAEQWEREKGYLIPRPFVHDALVGAFGGEWKDTPLGRARRSSADMNVLEFSAMIERTAEYLKEKYGCVLPKPEEWQEHV